MMRASPLKIALVLSLGLSACKSGDGEPAIDGGNDARENDGAGDGLDSSVDSATEGGGDVPPGMSVKLMLKRVGTGRGNVDIEVGATKKTCDGPCTVDVPAGSTVTLKANPLASRFVGWDGPCDGSSACTFTIWGDTFMSATFSHHEWSRVLGGSVGLTGVDVASAGDGRLVLAGTMGSGGEVNPPFVDLGGGKIESNGGNDVVVAVLDEAGKHIWSRTVGGWGNEEARAVGVDTAGNVYVVGRFDRDFEFAGESVTNPTTDYSTMLVKISATGMDLWARAYASFEGSYPLGIAVQPDGDVLVVGDFRSVMDIGKKSLVSAGGTDGYLAVWDSTGALRDAKAFGGSAGVTPLYENDGLFVAAALPDGWVVAGNVSTSFSYGGSPVASAGQFDVALMRIDEALTPSWVRMIGGVKSDYVSGLAVDAKGDRIAISGGFSGSADFGGGATISAGESDLFVAAYDGKNKFDWSHAYPNAYQRAEGVNPLAIDTDGAVLVAGEFTSTDFGGGVLESAGTSNNDVFVVKLLADGAYASARGFGVASREECSAMTINPGGAVILTGGFDSATFFGNEILTGRGWYLAQVSP